MGQDTNLLNFIIALVGVIGTGVGIAASLIPIELIGLRDSYQRTAKTWGFLIFETQRINKLCTSFSASLEQELQAYATRQDYTLKLFNRISLEGLQAVLANGDFITRVPADVRGKLIDMYHIAGLVNQTMNDYSAYIAASLALFDKEAIEARVESFYKIIASNCQNISRLFQELQQPLADFEKTSLKKERHVQIWINILKWFGGVIFVSVIAGCAFLAYVYIHH